MNLTVTKPIIKVVSERELAEALENLTRVWRGLDDARQGEFRELLRCYLEGSFTPSEWCEIMHAVAEWRATGLAARLSPLG